MSFKTALILSCGLGFSLLGYDARAADVAEQPDQSCIQRAQWVAPDGLQKLDTTTLIKKAATQKVVLLGEQHPDANHHRWQLQTITQLYAHNPNIVIGFEMFPRRVQPALDAWVRGELSEEEFLDETDWDDVWKYDANIYLPLFRFARMNRIPIIALNVERSLIGAVSQKGWDEVDDDLKEGVQTPREASADYRAYLKDIFSQHAHISDDDKAMTDRFQRFVDSQLTWDGAMAQEIARVQKMGGDPLVIGVMGSGHLIDGHGVPHQLEGLGLKSTVLLPWTLGWDCRDLNTSYADAIFGLEEVIVSTDAEKPMLGVRIDQAEEGEGVRVGQVIEESIAEDAGLEEGDIILSAAGVDTNSPKELVKIIQRQAPGTWLPLQIKRDQRMIDVIAKFPTQPQ